MPLPGAVLGPSPLLLPRDGLLLGALRLLALLLGRLRSLCLLLLRPLLLNLRLGALLLRSLLLNLRGGALLLWPLLLSLRGGALLLWPLLLSLRGGALLLRPLLLSLRGGALLLRLLSRSLLGALLLRLLFRSLLGLLLLRPLLLSLRGGALLLSGRLALFFLLIALRVSRVDRPEEHEQGSGADNSNKLHRNRSPLISLLGKHADYQSVPDCRAGVSQRCVTAPPGALSDEPDTQVQNLPS
jgi:hypothetical protein